MRYTGATGATELNSIYVVCPTLVLPPWGSARSLTMSSIKAFTDVMMSDHLSTTFRRGVAGCTFVLSDALEVLRMPHCLKSNCITDCLDFMGE